MITILGLDAGKTHFGYSVIQARLKGQQVQFRVVECGVVPAPYLVNDMLAGATQIPKFVGWIKKLCSRRAVNHLIGERFMTRLGGSSMGSTIECIAMCYGAIYATVKTELQLISAATWKNRVKKNCRDIKTVYKDRGVLRVAPHELDATMQALYKAYVVLGIEPSKMYAGLDFARLGSKLDAATTNPESLRRIKRLMK